MPDKLDDIFAAAAQRIRRLMDQLATAPLVEICGLVGPTSGSLSRSGKEVLWTLMLNLPVWRDAVGTLQTRKLYLRFESDQAEAKKVQNCIQVGVIARFKARVVVESALDRPEGLLIEIVGPTSSDVELNRLALVYQSPVYYDDSALGRFTLDRKYDWFESRVDWLGQSIDLRLSVEQSIKVEEIAPVARRLWADVSSWDERIRRYATDQLLSLKNDGWLEETEARVTADDFGQRLQLNAVHVDPDGSFSFWFDDDGMFGGHSVEVCGGIDAGPLSARMQG